MSIFQEETNQNAVNAAHRLTAKARKLEEDFMKGLAEIHSEFWSNPKATPEQIAQALGSRAAALFIAGRNGVDMIVKNHVDLNVPVTEEETAKLQALQALKPYVINNDNTVTLSDN